MRRIVRVKCFDAGGCYEAEYNRWPRDSIVWIRPIVHPWRGKIQASIVRQERNFLICDLNEVLQVGQDELLRVRIHKREVYDILTSPHFHYGLVGTRTHFQMPTYPHYRGKNYYESPQSSCKEE